MVLVANRQRPDDTLGTRGDPGGGEGAVSEELGQVEGVDEVGGGGLNLGDIEPCESVMLSVFL
jgi:hypothetical protein